VTRERLLDIDAAGVMPAGSLGHLHAGPCLDAFRTGEPVVDLSEDDTRVCRALADVATIGILAQRGLRQSELLAAQLQRALESRIAIEQAEGVPA
jgi:hypothetical protein